MSENDTAGTSVSHPDLRTGTLNNNCKESPSLSLQQQATSLPSVPRKSPSKAETDQQQANRKPLSVSAPSFDPLWRQKLGKESSSLLPDEVTIETVVVAQHVCSNHIVTVEHGEETESKITGKEEDVKSVADASLVDLQSSSQDIEQNHHNIDPPEEEISAISQSLTSKLIASGGDIRALLSSDQPLSTMQAQWDDTGEEGAGQEIASKDNEEEEDEEEERFVRPPRLRFALSEEAASDGFPSAIARSLRWHPDHMQDRPGEAANLSIRAAFDTKYDEHYVFRDWRPSQGRSRLHYLLKLLTLSNYYFYRFTCR